MLPTNAEIDAKIQEHNEKTIAIFKESQAIHDAYQSAPDEQNLVEEVEMFSDKLNEGIAELDKANESRKKLNDNEPPVI